MATRAAINVLYYPPKDAGAFEQYYADVHVPLVDEHAAAIGIRSVDLVKFDSNADGSGPKFYRMATLWFDSAAERDRGMKRPEFKALVDDLANFASGGVLAMVSQLTNG
jgi:uncharacterized protein (TIGR02118 family)